MRNRLASNYLENGSGFMVQGSGFDVLRAFRRNAVHVRHALDGFTDESGKMQVDGGYLQDANLIERFKRLSIPVRRALNPTDRASFTQSLTALLHQEPVATDRL